MSFREQLQRGLRVLSERLAHTRERLGAPLQKLLSRPDLSQEAFLQELERILLGADVGVELTERLLQHLRQQRGTTQELKPLLRQQLLQLLPTPPPEQLPATPTVVLVVGVNGSGKTTTAAKLAWRWKCLGKQPLLAAADTFRAAAIEQLAQWAERLGIPLIRQQYGADPAAVAYDALRAAQARAADVLIVDTAGRLHTKTPLMAELEKLVRVLRKLDPTAPHEVFLVLDAATGHNALLQAAGFARHLPLTGVVLTKLDGSAKGGMAFAVAAQFGVPIRYVGVGEGAEELLPFHPESFVDALLGTDAASEQVQEWRPQEPFSKPS